MVSAMEERNMLELGDSLRENSAGQGGSEGSVAVFWRRGGDCGASGWRRQLMEQEG